MAGLTARIVAPALAVWLSGVICLMCCSEICRAETDDCHGTTEPSCCAPKTEALDADVEPPAALSVPLESAPARGCMLSTARPDIEAPLPDGSLTAPALPAMVDVPVASRPEPIAGVASTYPVRSRGDTHLRCCVFLI